MFEDWMRPAFIACVILLLAIGCIFEPVFAHDPEHPELNDWFMGLESKGKSPCCDGSDALRLNDVDWESKDGHYRVRLEGEWVDVPDSAVVNGPNRAGFTAVWPYFINGKLIGIRCFIAGTMG